MHEGVSATPFKSPSALIPVAMSGAALAMTLVYVASVGVAAARQPDEGTVAHLFQILMAAQVPVVAVFAMTWLPRDPQRSLVVLALQGGAALAALAPVYLLGL